MSQVISALSVGFLLTLAGFLFWMEHGLRPVITKLKEEQVVTVYLAPPTDLTGSVKVIDQIKTQVGAKSLESHRVEIREVSSEDFVGDLKGYYPELAKELGTLGSDLESVVPRFISVSGILKPGAVQGFKDLPGVESVETSSERFQHIVGAFQALRWVARILCLGLCFALFTGLVHLSRMNADLHRDAVALLRLWGAGPWTLRVPAILSGLWVGVLGGSLASIGWIVFSSPVAEHVQALSPVLQDLRAPAPAFAALILSAGILMGFLSGVLGGGLQPGVE